MAKGHGPKAEFGWEFFGSELRRHREDAGLTQQELGERVFCTGSYIGQFETAKRRPQPDMAQRLDVELKTGGLLERMCRELLRRKPPRRDYFAGARQLEERALTIQEYAPVFVPGLLQTEAYARALFRAGLPFATGEDIDERVAARLARQKLLQHPTEPMFWVVLDENVIRRRVGGAAVMGEQLSHVAALAERRRIGLQVLPFDVGVPPVSGMLSLMTFEDAPPVAYSEGTRSGEVMDDPEWVTGLEQSYGYVRAAAFSPERSLALVQQVAKECVNGQ